MVGVSARGTSERRETGRGGVRERGGGGGGERGGLGGEVEGGGGGEGRGEGGGGRGRGGGREGDHIQIQVQTFHRVPVEMSFLTLFTFSCISLSLLFFSPPNLQPFSLTYTPSLSPPLFLSFSFQIPSR